ncbi:MAG: hypothetical protein HDT14_01345 [Oscillibacter sp.]|nr:hypothetical protein [Oscillibacter sp.]
MNILDKIYDEIYLEEEPGTEEYRKLRKSYFAAWDKVEEILGGGFSDEVWNAVVQLNTAQNRNCFKEGFCLGVQLMLEAYSLPGGPEAIR